MVHCWILFIHGEHGVAVFRGLYGDVGGPSLKPLTKEELGEAWGLSFRSDGSAASYDRNGPLSGGTLVELLTLLASLGYRRGMTWAEARVAVQACWKQADEQLDIEQAAQALPGVADFLARCQQAGIPMAVVTADETGAAIKHLSWLGLDHYFAEIIGTDQVERGKPFPDMVELACRRLGVNVSAAAVIGDSGGDMRMARSAGAAAAIGIASGDAWPGSCRMRMQSLHPAGSWSFWYRWEFSLSARGIT